MSSNPDNLWYWMQEREEVFLRRARGLPQPWTDDPILQQYRFCNVFRWQDKVSQWITHNWGQPYEGHRNMVLAMALARQINWPPTLAEIGFPKRWNPDRVAKVMKQRRARGEKVFTGAYIITGTLGGDKIDQVVYKMLDPLHRARICVVPHSLEETWRKVRTIPGFGGFMAYEVVSDLRHLPPMRGQVEDACTWAHAGPGAKRGLNRFWGRPVRAPVKDHQAVVEMHELLKMARHKLPKYFSNVGLEMRDIEHSLCEYDKYERLRLGEGSVRAKFTPSEYF